MNPNLEPKDLSKRPDHIELARKGGLSKSPRKALASRINGTLANKDLDDTRKRLMVMVKDKHFVEVILELISMNMEDFEIPHRRDKVIDQLIKLLPIKTINYNQNEFSIAERVIEAWKKRVNESD